MSLVWVLVRYLGFQCGDVEHFELVNDAAGDRVRTSDCALESKI